MVLFVTFLHILKGLCYFNANITINKCHVFVMMPNAMPGAHFAIAFAIHSLTILFPGIIRNYTLTMACKKANSAVGLPIIKNKIKKSFFILSINHFRSDISTRLKTRQELENLLPRKSWMRSQSY